MLNYPEKCNRIWKKCDMVHFSAKARYYVAQHNMRWILRYKPSFLKAQHA